MTTLKEHIQKNPELLVQEKISGKKFKPRNYWYKMADNAHEEDFFDDLEWELWKQHGNKKDPWETEDKIKQQVNDFIASIFDVMSDDDWLNKYSGTVNAKKVLRHAKRKGLRPIRRPIK